MRAFDYPVSGLILFAPAPLLRCLLLRYISQCSTSSPTLVVPSTTVAGSEVPEIVLEPLNAETVGDLTNTLGEASYPPVLVLCDIGRFLGLVAPERDDDAGHEGPAAAVRDLVRDITSGHSAKVVRETLPGGDPRQVLSPRELEVLRELALGSSNKQIAEALSIARNTVYSHVSHIQAKLKTENRTQTALIGRTLYDQS